MNSITLDGTITLGNAGSSSEGGYGFEVSVTNGIRGFYSNSGVKTYTETLFDYVDIVGNSLNCFVSMDRNKSLEFNVNRNNQNTGSTEFLYDVVTVENSSFVISALCVGNTGTASAVFNEARTNRF